MSPNLLDARQGGPRMRNNDRLNQEPLFVFRTLYTVQSCFIIIIIIILFVVVYTYYIAWTYIYLSRVD